MPTPESSTPAAPPAEIQRRHDLDALRAWAMLLGIVLHAAMSFYETTLWPVVDSTSSPLGVLLVVSPIHGFRMPLFFLLSGFFTAMLWRRRGLGGLLRHRAKRILAPLALACVTVLPLTMLTTYWVNPAWYQQTLLRIQETTGGDTLQTLTHAPTFAHLWFLWFLCWLVGAFAIVVTVGRLLPRIAVPKPPIATPLCLLWLVPMTWFTQRMMTGEQGVPGISVDLSAGLLPIPRVLGHYAIFFFFGAAMFAIEDAVDRLGRRWVAQLAIALLVVLPAMLIIGGNIDVAADRTLIEREENRHLVASLLASIYVWLMIFGLIGLFRAVLSEERPWARYVSDASYWLYLAHLPLIIAVQAAVRDAAIPPALKLIAVIIATTAILLLSYAWCVRYTWIGTLLNGRRERT